MGKWTRDYKNYLEELAQKGEVTEIKEYHQQNRVHFVLEIPDLRQIASSQGGVLKKFKLQSGISCSNYTLFNHESKIKRYASELQILKEYFPLRLQLYKRRKDYMLARLLKDYETLL